jgi:hypothetical protein
MATKGATTIRRVFFVDDGERHWVSAESEAEALEYMRDTHGGTLAEYVADCEPTIKPVPDDQVVKVYEHEPFRDPTPCTAKPAREWAAAERGIFASSCV